MEEAGSGLGLSMSVSNSYLIGQASLTTPTVSSPPPCLNHHPYTSIAPRRCGCCVVLDWSRRCLTCVCCICDPVCLSTPAPSEVTDGAVHPSGVNGLVAVWSLILFIHPSKCEFVFSVNMCVFAFPFFFKICCPECVQLFVVASCSCVCVSH